MTDKGEGVKTQRIGKLQNVAGVVGKAVTLSWLTAVSPTAQIEGGADPTERVLEAIRPTLRHLDQQYPSLAAYLEAMRALPFYNNPWSASLEEYLRQDIETQPNGTVRPKASAEGLQRDLDLHFQYSMCLHFPFVQCPALFIRAGEGLQGGDKGHIFTEPETDAIVEWIPQGRRVDLPPGANHYTMVLQDKPPISPPIRAFLDEVLQENTAPTMGAAADNFQKMRGTSSDIGKLS